MFTTEIQILVNSIPNPASFWICKFAMFYRNHFQRVEKNTQAQRLLPGGWGGGYCGLGLGLGLRGTVLVTSVVSGKQLI